MKKCPLCGKDFEDFCMRCPTCESGGENENEGNLLVSEEGAVDKPAAVFLIIANVAAFTTAFISIYVNSAGASRGLGGLGFAVVGAFCGVVGFVVTLILLLIAGGRKEKPDYAYMTPFLAAFANLLLFK